MKNKINKFLLVIFLVFVPLMASLAQGPMPPDPLGNPGDPTSLTSTNNAPSGAPIPDGVYIFVVLASIYGVSKYFQVKKQGKTT